MNAPVYTEAGSSPEPRQLALSHVSIEVGHFYMEDLLNGEERIRAQFREVARRLRAERAALHDGNNGVKPRISTCFLIDDYFRPDTDPSVILPRMLQIADECQIEIDYLAREAGCHEADGVPLAEITASMLLPEPPAGTTGARPPAQESGWLCNGQRTPAPAMQAMMPGTAWRPPEEFGKRNHTIFTDVEMWSDEVAMVDGVRTERRRWSCPFLAAVWQLIRLGALRHRGEPVAEPATWTEKWPSRWSELPAVIRLTDQPQPFAAYRTISILPKPYLQIEHAVDVILSHLDLDEAVVAQTARRADAEGVGLPAQVTERISHVFFEAGGSVRRW